MAAIGFRATGSGPPRSLVVAVQAMAAGSGRRRRRAPPGRVLPRRPRRASSPPPLHHLLGKFIVFIRQKCWSSSGKKKLFH
jgi:hypothetical protein